MENFKEALEIIAAVCTILGISVFGIITFVSNKSETVYATTASAETEIPTTVPDVPETEVPAEEIPETISDTLETTAPITASSIPETAAPTMASDIPETAAPTMASGIPEAAAPTIASGTSETAAPAAPLDIPETKVLSAAPDTPETGTSVSGPGFSCSGILEAYPGAPPDPPEPCTEKVPCVIGMDLDKGQSLLWDMGFSVSVCFEPEKPCYPDEANTYSAVIINQSNVDDILEIGTTIDLHARILEDYASEDGIISEEYIRVPNVVGKQQEDAAEILEDLGFTFEIWWNDEDFPDDLYYFGYIIGQSLEPGILVRRGCKISLHISAGAYVDDTASMSDYTLVPSVTGFSQEEAIRRLSEADLNYQVSWYEDDISGDKNDTVYISEQSIPSGTKVKKGTVVKLHVWTP